MRWARAYSTHGRNEKGIHIFLSENLKGSDHSEQLGLDWKIILKCKENRVGR
jgi:hypothetical protein